MFPAHLGVVGEKWRCLPDVFLHSEFTASILTMFMGQRLFDGVELSRHTRMPNAAPAVPELFA